MSPYNSDDAESENTHNNNDDDDEVDEHDKCRSLLYCARGRQLTFVIGLLLVSCALVCI